jgi:DNA-binding transcriptional regulator YiaG
MTDLSTRIRRLGFTHEAFAALVGVSERTVSRWASSGHPPALVCLLLDAWEVHGVPGG